MPTGHTYMGGMAGTAKSSGRRGGRRKPRNGRTPRPSIETAEKKSMTRTRKVRTA